MTFLSFIIKFTDNLNMLHIKAIRKIKYSISQVMDIEQVEILFIEC
jgi:hypothetical protein